MSDELDSLLTSFRPSPPAGAGTAAPSPLSFSSRGTARFDRRERKEKRAQASAQQLARVAVRTEQLNFRCSPQFKADIKALAEALGKSIADVAEDAIRPLVRKHLKDKQP
jgi:hypothetical protein